MSEIEKVGLPTEIDSVSPLEEFAINILMTASCEYLLPQLEKQPDGQLKKCGREPSQIVFWRDTFDGGEYPDSRVSCGADHSFAIKDGVAADLLDAGYDVPDFSIYVSRPLLSN